MPSSKIIMDRIEQGLEAPAKKDVDPLIDTRYFKEWEKLYLEMDRSSSSSFYHLDIRTLCSKPSIMTLGTREEIVQQCLSSNDSSGMEWTRLSIPRSKHVTDESGGKQISAIEQSWLTLNQPLQWKSCASTTFP